MHVLVLAMTWLVASSTPAGASAASPSETPRERPPPLREERPSLGEWQWLPSDPGAKGTRPGVWVTHPPLEFALDLLGVEAVQQCAVAIEGGAAACAIQVAPCQRLVLPGQGKLRLELDAACMAEGIVPVWELEGKAKSAPAPSSAKVDAAIEVPAAPSPAPSSAG